MSKIDFGGTVASNKPLLKGLMSGIDSEAIIEGLVSKKTDVIALEQDKVTFNTEKVTSFSVLSAKLESLENTLNGLKGETLLSDYPNLFASKKVAISAAEVGNPENYVNIVASADASIANLSVNVKQLAKNKVLGSSYFSSQNASITNPVADHSNTSLFTPGTFQINGVNVTIASGATLNDVAYSINNVSAQTNVSASIVQISSTQYSLFLSTTQTGTAYDITITDTDNCLNNTFAGAAIQQSQDAIINVSNIGDVTRSSNTITDFLKGITFELKAPTKYLNASGTLTSFSANVSIDEDSTISAAGIEDFVTQYNDFIKFVTLEQGRDELGQYHKDARIQQNEMLSNFVDDVVSFASQLVFSANSSLGIGFSFNTIPATGDEPQYTNLLVFDQATYANACNSNFDRVKKIFEFQGSSSSQNLTLYNRGNQIDSGTIQIDFNAATKSATATYNGQTVNCTYTASSASDPTKGGKIKGLSGTFLDGYEFRIADASSNASINYTVNQGVADKLFNRIAQIADVMGSDGMTQIQREVSYIADDIALRTKNIKDQAAKIDDYRESLIMKYSRLEAEIARANTLLTMIDIQLQVMSKK